MSDSSDFITPKECAALVKLSPAALYMRSRRGNGPPAHRIGPRLTRYRRSEVLAWLGVEAPSKPEPRERPTALGDLLKVWDIPAWSEDTEIAIHLAEFQSKVAQANAMHSDDPELQAAAVRIAGLQFAVACQERAMAASRIVQRIEALAAEVQAATGATEGGRG